MKWKHHNRGEKAKRKCIFCWWSTFFLCYGALEEQEERKDNSSVVNRHEMRRRLINWTPGLINVPAGSSRRCLLMKITSDGQVITADFGFWLRTRRAPPVGRARPWQGSVKRPCHFLLQVSWEKSWLFFFGFNVSVATLLLKISTVTRLKMSEHMRPQGAAGSRFSVEITEEKKKCTSFVFQPLEGASTSALPVTNGTF